MSFECAFCGAISHNINDERERYCGACHNFVGERGRLAYRDDSFAERWPMNKDRKARCAACGAEADYGRIRCLECGKPLVFSVVDGCK